MCKIVILHKVHQLLTLDLGEGKNVDSHLLDPICRWIDRRLETINELASNELETRGNL
jgi:hypothetical protein